MRPTFNCLKDGRRWKKKHATSIHFTSELFITPTCGWPSAPLSPPVYPTSQCYQIQAGDGAHASPGDKSVWYFSGVCEAAAWGLLRPQIRLI